MAASKPFSANIDGFSRKTFLDEIWDYSAGQHVTILAPYGGGKTQLGYQLLGITADKELPAIVFVMKPRDKTVDTFSRKFKFRIIRDWPPNRIRTYVDKPSGWVLWPKETSDPDVDDIRFERIF